MSCVHLMHTHTWQVRDDMDIRFLLAAFATCCTGNSQEISACGVLPEIWEPQVLSTVNTNMKGTLYTLILYAIG